MRDSISAWPTSSRARYNTAALHDPDLFRANLASRTVLTPLSETFALDGVAARTLELAGEHERMVISGPSREGLLRIPAGARTAGETGQ